MARHIFKSETPYSKLHNNCWTHTVQSIIKRAELTFAEDWIGTLYAITYLP